MDEKLRGHQQALRMTTSVYVDGGNFDVVLPRSCS